ncbi:MAG: N-6 DNA methylase [Nitrososphaerota archaeon]|jgi:type I restriction-modification system DNA methylase subunit|nr:N-6 DNA methylase [Nitrososphaerota archaeon]
MLTKEQSRIEVEKLVKKYDALGIDVNKLTEEETKKDFILPMFKALNWDTEDSREVSAEENISKKRVDYGFRIDGIPKFFLEAKAIKETLDTEHVRQSVTYSWLKSTTWAVLTNFKQLDVYNAEWKSQSVWEKRFFTLRVNEYVPSFDKLWLLGRDSFLEHELDRTAEEWGKKQKRVPVSPVITQLFIDLIDWRQRLTKNIAAKKSNMTLIKSDEELDECVQRILDRMIFIRVCEDREIEPFTLQSRLREWKGASRAKSFYKLLTEVFREFDQSYNSKLFANHLADQLDIDDVVLNFMIGELYENKAGLGYDFSAIDADVLGSIYEQYLGYILEKGKKRTAVVESLAQRKKMGIYYTPTYITEFIVKNTVEVALQEEKDGRPITILDPACGSGSFLLASLRALLGRQKAATFDDKISILRESIYGVDLDPKAVEIAQFNLLLRILERRKILPVMDKNIVMGNSLVDDTKIDPHSLSWNRAFPDVMRKGGFDVIVGNPPYVFGGGSGISPEEKTYFQQTYESGHRKLNLFSLFFERSIKLLRPGGLMGFIVPNTLLRVTSYEDTRKFILGNAKIVSMVNLEAGVFEDVTAATVILVLQKFREGETSSGHHIEVYDGLGTKPFKKPQSSFERATMHIFDLAPEKHGDGIYAKLAKGSVPLGTICKEMIFGVVITKNFDEVISDSKKGDSYKRFLEGRDIGRYVINFDNKYLHYDPSLLHRPRTPGVFEVDEKILVQRISGGKRPLKAAYDNEKYYDKESINNIILGDKRFNAKYILALMNSKLFSWYYASKFSLESTLTVNVSKAYLEQLPVRVVSDDAQKKIVIMTERMLELHKRLKEVGPHSDQSKRLYDEILQLDSDIDRSIYNIYELTDVEIKRIEDSLKED